MDTKVVTAHVPIALSKKVDALAGRMERSRGWILKQALAAWVDQEEARHKLTLEALAEVDAGALVSQESMEAWADGLGAVRKASRKRKTR
ncbi:MAG: ribbon-helix-helix protein, CopG family [Deltaproteobacteria bacterium]|nr:ribbon-helix-helix protein, CopG family [Deltaproteobacteria bacterium]